MARQVFREDCIHLGQLCCTLRWRHNGHDGISNDQPHHCLLNRFFGAVQRKHQSSVSLALCGNSPGPVNSPHKWPVMRKMVPFDDVIMACWLMVPSHSLNQCWLVICKVLWHSFEGKFHWRYPSHQSLKLASNYLSKISFKCPPIQ